MAKRFDRSPRMAIAALLLGAAATSTGLAASPGTRQPIELTYLGNAGWQIEAAGKVILVDPYITEFRTDRSDSQQITNDDPVATPDTAGIDAKIHRAHYILITHGHYDHMIDAPYIARKTGAVIICSDSAAHIARAYGIGQRFTPADVSPAKIRRQSLIVVRGGEDLQFDGFSLAVIPSLHTALFDKRYNDGFWAGSTPAGLTAPLHESDYAEGGTFIYLLRIAGHQLFIMGSMNYIEREISGLRPDVAIVGAGESRREIYDYAGRLMHALGDPPVVFPTHWDDYGTKPRAAALKQVALFSQEIHAAAPQTRIVVPDYFVPTRLN